MPPRRRDPHAHNTCPDHGAPHPDAGKQLIDYLLCADVSAAGGMAHAPDSARHGLHDCRQTPWAITAARRAAQALPVEAHRAIARRNLIELLRGLGLGQ
jgi:hypothetical protein